MRDADHFLSELDALGRSGTKTVDPRLASRLSASFCRLTVPVVGAEAAEGLFRYWVDSYGAKAEPEFPPLGYLAAFLLREYDGETMPLDRRDFEELLDTLNDAAGEIDMNVLTELMAELVSLGLLK